jgi:hypothetical protein
MSNPHKHCNHHLDTCLCKISRMLELEIDMDMLGAHLRHLETGAQCTESVLINLAIVLVGVFCCEVGHIIIVF